MESTRHAFKDPQSCPASHSTHHTTSTLSLMHVRGIGVLEGCNEGTLKGRDGPLVIPDSDAELYTTERFGGFDFRYVTPLSH